MHECVCVGQGGWEMAVEIGSWRLCAFCGEGGEVFPIKLLLLFSQYILSEVALMLVWMRFSRDGVLGRRGGMRNIFERATNLARLPASQSWGRFWNNKITAQCKGAEICIQCCWLGDKKNQPEYAQLLNQCTFSSWCPHILLMSFCLPINK